MEQLSAVLSAEGILYAVVGSPDGSKWEEFGRKEAVPYQGIISQYVPGPEAMANLATFLEGQILPKTIIQGNVLGVFFVPDRDTIVALFVTDESDTIGKMRKGRAIASRVGTAIAQAV